MTMREARVEAGRKIKLCFCIYPIADDDNLDEKGGDAGYIKEADSGNFLAVCPRALSLSLSSLTLTAAENL